MNAITAVKTLVIVMGILIVAGLGLLGYGMYSKAGQVVKGEPSKTVPVRAAAAVRDGGFGRLGLDQPAGSRITDATTSDNLLILSIEGGGLEDRVVVVDLQRGVPLGTVHIGSVPAPRAAVAADGQ